MFLVCSAAVALGVVSLVPAVPVQRSISGGETHTFQLTVAAGQFATGVVDQGDTDLTVTVNAPDGSPLATYDTRARAAESVSFVATASGAYRLAIRTVRTDARRATYRVQFEPLRPTTPGDAQRMEAEALATEAKRLVARRDRDSVRTALARLERALPLWRALGIQSAELATQTSIGEALYALNEHTRADEAFRAARALGQELGDLRMSAEALNGMAMIAWPRGDISAALDLLQEAVELCRAARFPYGEAAALSNSGILLWEAGRMDEAIQRDRRALAIVRAIPDRRGEAFALNNVAMVLDELGQRGEALGSLRRAVALFHLVGDNLAEGRTRVSQARVQLSVGASQAALLNVRRGLTLIRTSSDRLAEADGLRQLGRIRESLRDREGARRDYEQARALYQSVGSRRGESEVAHALGLSYLADGDCASALPLLEQGLQARLTTGLRRLAIESRFKTALAERSCGNLTAARALLEAALADTEQLRAGLFEKEQRTSLVSSRLSYYNAYVAILLDLHRLKPDAGFDALAFEASERARARELIERWRELADGLEPAGGDDLRRRERDLRQQINYWSWQLWQQSDRPISIPRESELRARIDGLLATHAEVQASASRSDPRYAALLRTVEPVPLATFQRDVLDDDTVLVEYSLGDERSYVWAVTRQDVTVAELPKRAVVERLALEFHRLLRESQHAGAPAAARLEQVASALGRMLLSPVAGALGKRRILTVADGALHYIPFAALREPNGRALLVEHHDLAAVPSATMLAQLRRDTAARAPAPKRLAVIADPVFDALDGRNTRQSRATLASAAPPIVGRVPRRLNRLAFAGEAAARIAAMAPADSRLTAVGLDASRTLAMSPELAQYQIIEFDTHAYQDDQHPDLSGLVLSLVDAAGTPQDGFLRLHDVYSMNLRANVVILSACETGLGRLAGSEGVAGLASGFLAAGASTVVSTLWEVNDEASAALMLHFHSALVRDVHASPAAALRAAQLAMKHTRWRSSYYWAAFVLQGNW